MIFIGSGIIRDRKKKTIAVFDPATHQCNVTDKAAIAQLERLGFKRLEAQAVPVVPEIPKTEPTKAKKASKRK